jgi:hypothetical protein
MEWKLKEMSKDELNNLFECWLKFPLKTPVFVESTDV